jgi:signal transduction histidine kinase
MLHLTTAADWFLSRAHFPHSRDRIRGRTFILVLGLNLLFQIILSFLLPDDHRLFPFATQILIQVLAVFGLLFLTKATGRYRVAAVIHFFLQKVFMALVFASSESLHSIYFASMSTDVVMASFILGLRFAIPLTVVQALATLTMVQRNGPYAANLPFGMDLAAYAGLLAFSILLSQFSMILFSWLYHGSLQEDYAKLQRERTRLFRSARTFDLSRMLGELNHHVNNPLSVIHAQLYRLALQSRKRSISLDERQLTGASAEAMQKIRFIVEHLRLLASPDSQESISTISVRSLCLHILTHFQENFRLKGISLQFVDQTMNMSFAWRRHELFTILVAVIQNAGEAVERSTEKRVTMRIERYPQRLLLTITDSGPGIPDEQRAQLFKPFHSTKQGSRHLGLSLLTAKAVLEDRGGTIACEDVGQGCSFYIGLPLGLTGV